MDTQKLVEKTMGALLVIVAASILITMVGFLGFGLTGHATLGQSGEIGGVTSSAFLLASILAVAIIIYKTFTTKR